MASRVTSGTVSCVVWEFRRDDGRYSPYDPECSEAVERAYAAHLEMHSLPDRVHTISFKSMTQTTVRTGRTQPIRRCALELPSSPDIMGYWLWEESTSSNKFIPFSILASVDIELAQMTRPADKTVDLSTRPSAIPYTVDIGAMVQVRHGYGTRRVVCKVELPRPLQSYLRVQGTHHQATPTTAPVGGNAGHHCGGRFMLPPATMATYPNIVEPFTNMEINSTRRTLATMGKPHATMGTNTMGTPAIRGVPTATGTPVTIGTIMTSHGSQVTVTSPAAHMTNSPSLGVPDHCGPKAPSKGANKKERKAKTGKKGKVQAGITGDPLIDCYIATVTILTPGEDDSCPVCLGQLSEPSYFDQGNPPVPTIPYARPIDVCRLMKCKHMLHRSCLLSVKSHAKNGFQCPLCKKMYGVRTGDMPDGTMTVCQMNSSLPGYEGYGTYEITYNFKAGVHNGRRYWVSGFPRRCYLPHCPQGTKVLDLLKVAWTRKLTFTIGTSVSTGMGDTVVWNEIHHKTSITNHGGHGYPDPGYLDNVIAELASQGVTSEGDSGTSSDDDSDP